MTTIKNRKVAIRLLLIAVLLSSTIYAQDSLYTEKDWEVLEFPVEENLTEIQFLGTDTAFLVTSGGRCAVTVNAAAKWNDLPVSLGTPLEGCSFLNTRDGLVCGRQGALYRTTNGGQTWQNSSLSDTLPWLLSVALLDQSHAVVVGMSREPAMPLRGLALHSDDGGKTWEKLPAMGVGYGELFYSQGEVVYFLSYGKINYSQDLGETWRSTMLGLQMPPRVCSFSGPVGIIGGNAGVAALTIDGGQTWQQLGLDNEIDITSAVMLDARSAFMAGLKSKVVATTDGGRSWEEIPVPKEIDIFDMSVGGNFLYVVGSGGAIMRLKLR